MSGVMYCSDASHRPSPLCPPWNRYGDQFMGRLESYPAGPLTGSNPTTGDNLNLLSQVNVEEYGSLFKIIYEIRYSREGWDSGVYVNI